MWFRRRRGRLTESQQAILDSNRDLRAVQDREKEVREVARTLKDIREKNHFADKLRVIMEGG